jgi:hypothetical protein
MQSPESDLKHRRIAWSALSDLFLDTDTSLSRQWRAQQLATLPYSIQELESILINEVYPICRWNLLCVAGEWAGFDLDWLEAKILRRLNSPLAFLHRFNLGRVTVHRSHEWQATKSIIAEIRQNAQLTSHQD